MKGIYFFNKSITVLILLRLFIIDFCFEVITVTHDILNKLSLVGYDLNEYSLDTVKMFYNDAVSAGFKI